LARDNDKKLPDERLSMQPYSFEPGWPLKSGMLQTLLSSSSLRARGHNPMADQSRRTIVDTVDGVRLLGYLALPDQRPPLGMVILLHGWEGSADSTYIRNTGNTLFQQGYAIFRLNFRDHGNSHHLNEGIFYAVLTEEVFAAVRYVAGQHENLPVHIVGFSLGGNFALRIARRCCTTPINNLKRVVAISPVLDPDKATDRIDQNTLIRDYFIRKWFRSLSIKQALYPDKYNFTDIKRLNSIRSITAALLERYSSYDSVEAYFKGYTLIGSALNALKLPTTLLIAEDDPIIPIEDFKQLELSEAASLAIQKYGGHNGFISGLFLKSWYEQQLSNLFAASTGS
jgi:predicted alpha/beta-fold hydrolase